VSSKRCARSASAALTGPPRQLSAHRALHGASASIHSQQARTRSEIPIARGTAAPFLTPQFRALALFGRRQPERVVGSSLPASETLAQQQTYAVRQKRAYSMTLVGAARSVAEMQGLQSPPGRKLGERFYSPQTII